MYLCTTSFTHLSIDEYLVCFHILALVGNATVNIGLTISLAISVLFSLDKYPEVELLDQMVILFLIFLRNFHTIFHSGSTNLQSHPEIQGFPFLHIITNTCYFFGFLVITILIGVS